jgi:hypothetical protein
MPRTNYQVIKRKTSLRSPSILNSNSKISKEPSEIKQNLFKEIESIKPDHEQRKLAVEVNILIQLKFYHLYKKNNLKKLTNKKSGR